MFILLNNTLCASINKVLSRNVVHAKSTNVTKTHRFASAFYHRSRNYGNRASGQSISRNNSIKSASLARKKQSPVRCEFYRRLFSAFPPFFRISLFVYVEKFAASISRSRINRDALVLWCLLKQTVAVTPADAMPVLVVAFTIWHMKIRYLLHLRLIHTRIYGRITTVRPANFDKIVMYNIQTAKSFVEFACLFAVNVKYVANYVRIYVWYIYKYSHFSNIVRCGIDAYIKSK